MADSTSVHEVKSTVDAISTQVLKRINTLVVGDRNILKTTTFRPASSTVMTRSVPL